ncbi:MAG: alpha-galactosidase [Parapedobacter sp.]
MNKTTPRRKFIKQLAGSTMAIAAGTSLVKAENKPEVPAATDRGYAGAAMWQVSEDLTWDTLRGHFKMNLTLDPPAQKWEKQSDDGIARIAGEYRSNGYLLKIDVLEKAYKTVIINFDLSRLDGKPFKILENRVECKTSYAGVYKLFTTGTMAQQNYRIDLPFVLQGQSRAQFEHPIIWMQQTDGRNTLTLGLLSQIHTCNLEASTYNPANGGEAPGIANSYVRAGLNRSITTGVPTHSYKDGIYINADDNVTWFEALQDYSITVDEFRDFEPDPISDWALNPMWHSWYAHADRIDEARIRNDAQLAAKLGVTTIELDAGWNIPWEHAYSFDTDGDYFFDGGRFPDPVGMVKEMHNNGQRVILHVAPLLMGKHAKAWPAMNGCMLMVDGQAQPYLDPRMRKVHDYLSDAWEYMFDTYDIDGLWYDFLEIPEKADPVPAGISTVSLDLHQAYTLLMQRLYRKALECNPNAVIILRRGSANLNAKTYCTHVWPMDVPQDYNMNRRDVVFLKTYGAGVLTHACCTSWAISESDVNVARQMASITLAGVPAFSVILQDSPTTHNQIVKAWLEFYHRHKEDLVLGQLTPLLPTPPSALLKVVRNKQAFFGFFEAIPGLITVEGVRKIFIINAYSNRTTTRLEGVSGQWKVGVFDQVWEEEYALTLAADENNGLNLNLSASTGCHAVMLTKTG